MRASARIMSGAGSAAGASHSWTKLPAPGQRGHLLGSAARPAQVERVDAHAGVGLVRLGDERERLIDRPDGAPRHELERDVHAVPCSHPAQPGEPVQRRVPVVGGDDRQEHGCPDLGGGIGRPDRAHRVEIRAEEEDLDIERPDPESTAGAPDVADGDRVVDHLVLEAEVGRGEEAQPDGIEPGRGGRLDLLDGRRAADGQVIERQSPGGRRHVRTGRRCRRHRVTPPVTSAGLVGRPVAAASWTAIVAARVARPSRPSIRGGTSPRTTAQK